MTQSLRNLAFFSAFLSIGVPTWATPTGVRMAFRAEPVIQTEISGEALVLLKREAAGRIGLSNWAKTRGLTIEPVGELQDVDLFKVTVPALRRAAWPQGQLFSALRGVPGVRSVEPNYRYSGGLRDGGLSDPKLKDQDHHVIMENTNAWDIESGGQDIVVAVTDDGTSLQHEDLVNQYWRNPGEIPGNKVDDDQNGFVDDIYGWNFVGNNPNVETDDPGANDHGTHVAGIVAAERGNGKGVSGTGPGLRLMILKWVGLTGGFTTEIVTKSYLYAANNGARIITTSYNIDGFVSDKVYRATLETVYAKGVLLLNSAGNNAQQDPPRQIFTPILLVCSTESLGPKPDEKSGFSNWGSGVDLCAPGADILSTVPGNLYLRMSGTSMATPNAAAAAGLIWSKNPTWSRDQVAAQLLGSADNIDAQNAAYAGLLGSGRANSRRALTETIRPPVFSGLLDLGAKGILRTKDKVRVAIKRVFDPAGIMDPASWTLAGPGGAAVDFTISGSYKVGSNEVTLRPVTPLAPGEYKLVGKAAQLKDPFGQALDGNADGTSGDDYEVSFQVN